MLAKLNFLQNKSFIFVLALTAILVNPLNAADTKSCEYKTFSMKIDEKVTAVELLTQIADSCDFSIIIKDSVAQKTLQKELFGINAKNLSLNEIFDVIILNNDLYYEYTQNFLKIYALETKTFKFDYITSVRTGTAILNASFEGATTAGDTTSTSSSTNTISSNDTFDFWPTLQAEITSILNTGSEEYISKAPIINQNAGLITITATKKQLERIGEYLTALEKRLHKQVLIDVNILSVDLTEGSKTGIDWSKFQLELASSSKFNNSSTDATGTHTFSPDTITGNPLIDTTNAIFANNKLSIVNDAVFSMTGLMNFLGNNGDAKVISSPKVLALNNQQALITIGDTINYKLTTTATTDTGATGATTEEVKSIFVGVLLNITPEITDNGEIILRINPSVSELKDSTLANDSTLTIAPNTAEKKLSTVVKVKNNNTIILGGLITTSDGVTKTNVPLLSDIPLLGEAFKSSSKTKATKELVFVITPRIIGPKDNTKITLKDLGFSKRVYEQ